MKFLVRYQVGKHMRSKKIIASDLDEAEIVCNKKVNNWQDVIMVDKTKGEEIY